jgi:glutamate synthase (NADPH/NADH) large chain
VECHPLVTPDGSDSTSLDEAIELISRNGRTLAEAVRMLLPPAPNAVRSEYMRYHAQTVEPWDGPAALTFADGVLVGAAMDRNGLRPCRYFVMEDGLVFAGSEAGLVDLDPERISRSERLGPGEMLIVDLDAKKLYDNDALNRVFDQATGFGDLLDPGILHPLADASEPRDPQDLLNLQRGFGYTREDVKMVLAPMALDAKDAVWSMGDDTPIAPLSHTTRSVYAYFRQRFAQVTNPAIDPLRESCVTSLKTRLGPWPHLLNKNAPLPGIEIPSPFLSRGQVATLRAARHPNADALPVAVLDCVFPASSTLSSALDDVCARACDLVLGGAAILLLTDRGASSTAMPIPMAMATGAVHSTLVNRGLRTHVGLAVEAGDCRDLHHAAVLVGYGAGAVCPWLAFETAAQLNPDGGEERMQRALELGLAKVMAKMGISVVDSYRGAHLFDAIGLDDDIIHRCFFGTPSPLSGCSFAHIEASVRSLWQPSTLAELPDPGWVRFRRHDGAEFHAWQPPTVKAVQQVAGTARGAASAVLPVAAGTVVVATIDPAANPAKRPAALRDLLEVRPAGSELRIDQVEPTATLMKRFIASAMSLGSLSPEAHHTITEAMNSIGARSNTGEGGEDPAVYRPTHPGGPLLLNNKIKQVASGRFGVTAEYLAHAEELEIKIAQGSKPGEGGQLPAHKVTELIARLRHAQPGVALISPPPHHDIYSIEDLAQLIYDLKRVNPRARIGVKLVSGLGIGTVAAGVAKAYADYVIIAGNSGGTGASPLSSIKYAGNPWELGLAEVQQVLMQNQLRGRVRLRVDGGLSNARDVLIAALLGAEEFAFGTSVLVALGCDMARQCHLNTCPTGIATQRPDLRAKFRGKPEHVIRFFDSLANELQQLLARLGLPSLAAATGRTDLLEQVRHDGGLDLSPMLKNEFTGPRQSEQNRNPRPEIHPPVDDPWVEAVLDAQRAGRACEIKADIVNEDRSLGARLAGTLAMQQDRDTRTAVSIQCRGTSGQSFGAFAVAGMKMVLDGQANDFVGKGLSGGEIVIRAVGSAARESSRHVILGNVALYGATSGSLLAAGRAGERFAVRNSGAHAVVEGVGDHGCEYMTGGSVVVLGEAGTNFGAGMTGGMAYVYDEGGRFIAENHYHAEFVAPKPFADCSEDEQTWLYGQVVRHAEDTGSSRARDLLGRWSEASSHFLRVSPV